MFSINRSTKVVRGAALMVLAACGGPGLPPAGPQPGDVDVGYGTEPAEQVTGAVTSVPGERSNGGARIDELLRGRVAGLQIIPKPEGGYTFRIRGVTTLTGEPPEPLFVVDGSQVSAAQIESALAGLTRDDIRQVDVLKDIASTSVYGTRGVGGVIIINTKRR